MTSLLVRTFKRVVLPLLSIAVLCVFAFPSRSSAVTQASSGFSVSPGELNITVNQQQPTQQATLTVTNSYTKALPLAIELKSIDESGARLLPTGDLDETFAAALKVAVPRVVVPARGSAQIQITVSNTSQLQPGGHYASVVITQEADASAIPALRAAVAVNLFVVKSDGVKRDLQLTSIETARNIFSLPKTVKLSFQNNGNTHVVPRASVILYDEIGGTTYGKAVVNTESQPVFPGNAASFSAPVQALAHSLIPKKLHMYIMYRIDGTDVQLVKQMQVWYIPPIDVLFVAVVLAVLWWQRRTVSYVLRFVRKRTWSAAKWLGRLYHTAKRAKPEPKPERIGATAVRAYSQAKREHVRQYASQLFGKNLVHKTDAIRPDTPKAVKIAVHSSSKKVASKTSTKSAKPAPKKQPSKSKSQTATAAKKTVKKKAAPAAKKPKMLSKKS